jgi:hypothetical protein
MDGVLFRGRVRSLPPGDPERISTDASQFPVERPILAAIR